MMLTPDGSVKLMDFGIARSASDRSLTMTGTTLGSLNYMPPEQVKGDPADNRSDLYSLGVSLYEMVTGQLPFQADSNYAMMAAHLQEVPKPPIVVRPGIPQPLNQIIIMALAKDPGQRFQSADAFRGALKSVPTQGMPTQPGVDPRAYAPSPSANAGSATALFHETPASQSPTTLMDTPAYQRTQPVAAASAGTAAALAGSVPQAAPPPVVSGSSHRGLYIALGAFIVVAVLFAAGLYLPSRIKTLAGAGKTAVPQQSQQASPVTSSDTVTPSSATPASTDPTAPTAAEAATASASAQSGQSSPDGSSASSASDPSAATNATPSSGGTPAVVPKKPSAGKSKKDSQAANDAARAKVEEAAQAEEVEKRYDDVDSRSSAVAQSLDNLQRQQAASGYGLRGDIVSAQQRMKTDLSKAQFAMQKQDTKAAKRYLDMAEAELQTLEKFLGR
jgi:serine/threonine protein kinase